MGWRGGGEETKKNIRRQRELVEDGERAEPSRSTLCCHRTWANEGNANRQNRQVKQACAWAEQRTMGVFVGVLNDNEEDQDGDDPSGTHHDNRGVRGQIGGPCSMCPRGFWACWM